MADFSPPTRNAGKGVQKSKKLSTRVDLTPMVDLGFLLITFFIFTTSMSEPKSLKLKLPDDRSIDRPNESAQGATLQLILGKDDQLWCYYGSDLKNIQKSSYGRGVRNIIIQKKKFVKEHFKSENDLVLIIKPTRESSIKNLVSILDEIIINEVTRYVIMEPGEVEMSKILY